MNSITLSRGRLLVGGIEHRLAVGRGDRRLPLVGRSGVGRGQRRHALRHVEDAGEVFRPLDVARKPVEVRRQCGRASSATNSDDRHSRRMLTGPPDQLRKRTSRHHTVDAPAVSLDTQVSLVPPPWLELTTSEPSLSATRVSPPGTTRTPSAPGQHVGTQVDVARREAARRRSTGTVDSASVGWAMKSSGSALSLAANSAHLRLGRVRPDQHAVAARAVHLLDHQLVEIVEHVLEGFGLAAAVRRHVLQDRLLAQEEPHDLRHVAVDRLVVGDRRCRSRSRCVTLPAR